MPGAITPGIVVARRICGPASSTRIRCHVCQRSLASHTLASTHLLSAMNRQRYRRR